jgi:hypothetical protein
VQIDRRGHRDGLGQRAQAPLDRGRQVTRGGAHAHQRFSFGAREPELPSDVLNTREIDGRVAYRHVVPDIAGDRPDPGMSARGVAQRWSRRVERDTAGIRQPVEYGRELVAGAGADVEDDRRILRGDVARGTETTDGTSTPRDERRVRLEVRVPVRGHERQATPQRLTRALLPGHPGQLTSPAGRHRSRARTASAR